MPRVIEKHPEASLDSASIRAAFPVLATPGLVYLDSAATTQKPQCVLDRMHHFYCHEYATVRRGVYGLSARATLAFDAVREQVAQFLNAATSDEIVFTKGTTEAINLVATSFARPRLQPGDEILVSAMEHHANIVPWQQVLAEKGGHLRVIPMNDAGELCLETYDTLLTDKTRLVAVTAVSNALGTVNPIQKIVTMAHARGIPVLVDGAQATPHMAVDVQALDCDFYAFSSHKIYGPTGVGVLYAKYHHLEAMPPYQSGGDMIESVTFEKTTFAPPPHKFEAGTPPIAEVIGLGEALRYVSTLGLDQIQAHEAQLLATATVRLQDIPGLRIIGTAAEKAGVVSFVFDDIHPHDVGTLLDQKGIAVRAGHHCAQPTMARFHVPATTRASFALYNTIEDIDRLVDGLQHVMRVFR